MLIILLCFYLCFCIQGILHIWICCSRILSGPHYSPYSIGHCLFMFSVLYLLVAYLSLYWYIYSCIWLREYSYLYLCICWLSSLGSCSPVVLIIPLSLSFIQQPENYVALLDILVHFFASIRCSRQGWTGQEKYFRSVWENVKCL